MNVLLGIPILRGELLNFRGVCSWSLSFLIQIFWKEQNGVAEKTSKKRRKRLVTQTKVC